MKPKYLSILFLAVFNFGGRMPACNFATEQSNSLSQGWLVEKALDSANGRESNIEYGAKLGARLTMDIWPRSDRSAQGNRKELRPLRPLLSSHTTGKLNDRKILSHNICLSSCRFPFLPRTRANERPVNRCQAHAWHVPKALHGRRK